MRPVGAVAFEDVSFRYEPEQPLIDDLVLVVEAGADGRDRRPDRRRQDDARQPADALLRARRRDASRSTGSTPATLTRDDLRRSFGMVLQDTWLFHGTIRENIAYGRLDATRGGDPRRRRGRPRRPLRPDAAGRLRHGHRRRRDEPVGRREAAPDDRPGVPRRPADPHPRRGDVVGRHADRGPHPAGDGRADARAGRRS